MSGLNSLLLLVFRLHNQKQTSCLLQNVLLLIPFIYPQINSDNSEDTSADKGSVKQTEAAAALRLTVFLTFTI